MVQSNTQKGFTLLELLIVMALIAILVGIVFAALNPGRQFANARNTTRLAHLNTIMNAISSNMAENNGNFACAGETLTTTPTNMSSTAGDYDIAPCIVTEYISQVPFDPSTGSWTSEAAYDSGYSISQDADGRVTLTASSAEIGASISMTR